MVRTSRYQLFLDFDMFRELENEALEHIQIVTAKLLRKKLINLFFTQVCIQLFLKSVHMEEARFFYTG